MGDLSHTAPDQFMSATPVLLQIQLLDLKFDSAGKTPGMGYILNSALRYVLPAGS